MLATDRKELLMSKYASLPNNVIPPSTSSDENTYMNLVRKEISLKSLDETSTINDEKKILDSEKKKKRLSFFKRNR